MVVPRKSPAAGRMGSTNPAALPMPPLPVPSDQKLLTVSPSVSKFVTANVRDLPATIVVLLMTKVEDMLVIEPSASTLAFVMVVVSELTAKVPLPALMLP